MSTDFSLDYSLKLNAGNLNFYVYLTIIEAKTPSIYNLKLVNFKGYILGWNVCFVEEKLRSKNKKVKIIEFNALYFITFSDALEYV